jgi:hypothetical protein
MIESRSASYGLLALPAAACEAEAEADSFSLVALALVVGLGSAPAASVSGGEYSLYCPSRVGCGSDNVTEGIGKRGG